MSMATDLLIIGGLSNPAKMPSFSWSLPAEHCKLGSKLRQLDGTTCSNCYACKGAYRFPGTVKAMARRFDILQEALSNKYASASFIAAFARVLNARYASTVKRLAAGHSIGNDGRFFRWHDSGDLQSVAHLGIIVEIARLSPDVAHWLPTREIGMVRDWLNAGHSIPENLVIRLSSPRIDSAPHGISQSLAIWSDQVTFSGVHAKQQPTQDAICTAYERDGECDSCRACWDSERTLISYPLH